MEHFHKSTQGLTHQNHHKGDFDKWLVSDLKEYLLQYDITINDIKGSGKNGNVIKIDLIRAAEKVRNQTENEIYFPESAMDVVPNIFNNLPVSTARLINKQTLLESSSRCIIRDYIPISKPGETKGVKQRDFVLYDDGLDKAIAIVTSIYPKEAGIYIVKSINQYYIKEGQYLRKVRKFLTLIKVSKDFIDQLPEYVKKFMLKNRYSF